MADRVKQSQYSTVFPLSSIKYFSLSVLKIMGCPTKCPQAPLALLAAFSRSVFRPVKDLLIRTFLTLLKNKNKNNPPITWYVIISDSTRLRWERRHQYNSISLISIKLITVKYKLIEHPAVHNAKGKIIKHVNENKFQILDIWVIGSRRLMPIENCRGFPKIVSVLALRVTSIFIGFTNRFFLLFTDSPCAAPM